jgi:hypothetical protein
MMCRKILPPATGLVRWLPREVNGNMRIEITPAGGEPQTYEIEELKDGYNLHSFNRDTYEFVRYRIRFANHGMWTCSCPDAQNRPERLTTCKHTRGLKAGLKALPF